MSHQPTTPEHTIPALAFTLGGAPNEPHILWKDDVRGIFHPAHPRPVGEGCDISLEQAQSLSDHPGVCVELVYITSQEAADNTAALRALEAVARRGVRDAVERVQKTPAVTKDQQKRLRRETGQIRQQLDALNPDPTPTR